MSTAKRSRKKYSNFNNFVAIARKMLWNEEWKNLTPAAKLFYIYLKAKYNGNNNGKIRLYYSDLKGIKGISSSSTIFRSIKELVAKDWIERTKLGGLYRHNNEFKLTGKYDDHLA